MRPRDVIAPPWLAFMRASRTVGLRHVPAGGFRILIFHDVPEAQWEDFDALLVHIETRHRLIDPDEAGRLLSEGFAPPARDCVRVPCLLSFDDGFVSNLALAKSVLADHGAKAIFFVCPGLVDLPHEAQRDAVAANVFCGAVGEDPPPDHRLLGWGELAELRDLGHAIGAHGLNHRRLAELRGAELAGEVQAPGRRIGEELGVDVPWFAYPFGDIGAIDGEALAVIGRHYRFCRSGVRGLNVAGGHRLAVLADQVDLSTSRTWQELVLEGGLDIRYRSQRRRLDTLARAADHNTPS